MVRYVTFLAVACLMLGAQTDLHSADWPQFGGSSLRNAVAAGNTLPESWNIATGRNIRWVAKLGSLTCGSPVVAGGKVFIGTNNGAGHIRRFPANTDLGCLLCFREADGQFLWQHSNPTLAAGRGAGWPLAGVCSTPLVEADRLWYVNNRCEIVCLDTRGFRDGENDGPFKFEPNANRDEADVIWKVDMRAQLGVVPRDMSSCSVTSGGRLLFVVTSNGWQRGGVPAPQAPSFLAIDKRTGKVVWSDASPGLNILHGQWSSPAYGALGGVPQVIFPGGDGWLYAFDPNGDGRGRSKLLWKFDCNPKTSRWLLGGRGTRNNIIAMPVIDHGRVYIAVGQDPQYGEGNGHLWCIDPTKRGDVSRTLAVDKTGKPIPHRRLLAVDANRGDRAIPNGNSAVVWHYGVMTEEEYENQPFEEQMHRSCSNVAIKNNLLFAVDFSGLVHCLDARTGRPHWSHDLFAAVWSSPLIVGDRVYIGDEDGDVAIFKLAKRKQLLDEINMGNAIYPTPAVANDTLFIAAKHRLFAIRARQR